MSSRNTPKGTALYHWVIVGLCSILMATCARTFGSTTDTESDSVAAPTHDAGEDTATVAADTATFSLPDSDATESGADTTTVFNTDDDSTTSTGTEINTGWHATDSPSADTATETGADSAVDTTGPYETGTDTWVDTAIVATAPNGTDVTTDLPLPTGFTCESPLPLDLNESKVAGNTEGSGREYRSSQMGSGEELVYEFSLGVPVIARFDLSGSRFNTVMYLRTVCDDADSEIIADDDGGVDTASEFKVSLLPGTYYLFVDGFALQAGEFVLNYDFTPNPCEEENTICPGTPECVPAIDWESYKCQCPQGERVVENRCEPNPCWPNPCTAPNTTICIPKATDYQCGCNVGYVSDGADGCIDDPDAADWTVMIYLNADNDLNDYGFADLDEISTTGASNEVRIPILFDSQNTTAQVLDMTTGGYAVLEDWGELDMSDWRTLRKFGTWAVSRYPARHYALILWNHGSGWKTTSVETAPWKGFSEDDSGTADEISIASGHLSAALLAMTDALGAKLDIIGFDACLMGMWEVAVTTAPYARYLVASEEKLPASGWSYDGVLPQLVKTSDMAAETLCIQIADATMASGGSKSTMSVIGLDAIPQLNAAVSSFANEMMAAPDVYPQIAAAADETEFFDLVEYRDFRMFVQKVTQRADAPPSLLSAADLLTQQLDTTIVYSRTAESHPQATGMSVYLPVDGKIDNRYSLPTALWSVETTWDEFLVSLNTW